MAKAGATITDIQAENTTATATVVPEVVEQIHAGTQEGTAETDDIEILLSQ